MRTLTPKEQDTVARLGKPASKRPTYTDNEGRVSVVGDDMDAMLTLLRSDLPQAISWLESVSADESVPQDMLDLRREFADYELAYIQSNMDESGAAVGGFERFRQVFLSDGFHAVPELSLLLQDATAVLSADTLDAVTGQAESQTIRAVSALATADLMNARTQRIREWIAVLRDYAA